MKEPRLLETRLFSLTHALWTSPLVGSASRLVDLLVAADHLLGTQLDRCPYVLKLEPVVEPVAIEVAEEEEPVVEEAVAVAEPIEIFVIAEEEAVIEEVVSTEAIADAYEVLSVASVGHPLDRGVWLELSPPPETSKD